MGMDNIVYTISASFVGLTLIGGAGQAIYEHCLSNAEKKIGIIPLDRYEELIDATTLNAVNRASCGADYIDDYKALERLQNQLYSYATSKHAEDNRFTRAVKGRIVDLMQKIDASKGRVRDALRIAAINGKIGG